MADYITLLTYPKPCNKKYTRLSDGTIKKESVTFAGDPVARTFNIPTLLEMFNLYKDVSEHPNTAVIFGYIPEAVDGEEYTILSNADIQKKFGPGDHKGIITGKDGIRYARRSKSNFRFSNYTYIDRDHVDGTPEELVYPDFETWWSAMEGFLPMLKGSGKLVVPSNSSRILDGFLPYDSHENNCHVIIKCKNSEDVGRFGKAALIHSFSSGHGFMRPVFSHKDPTKQTGQRPWSINDPTTFSQERLIYDGKPTVHDNLGLLQVCQSEILYFPGGLVDTLLLPNPSREQEKLTGMDLTQTSNAGCYVHDTSSLTFETEVNTKEFGWITVGEIMAGDREKMRCQAIFRPDSSSMAGYINFNDDGSIFHFDVGTGTKYSYKSSDAELYNLVMSGPGVEEVKSELSSVKIDRPVVGELMPVSSSVPDTESLKLRIENLKRNDTASRKDLMKDIARLQDSDYELEMLSMLKDTGFWSMRDLKASLKSAHSEVDQSFNDGGCKFFDMQPNGNPMDTYGNFKALMKRKGVSVTLNEMSHGCNFTIRGYDLPEYDKENLAMAYVENEMKLARMGHYDSFNLILRLSMEHAYHPFIDYLNQSPGWDGVDRIDYVLSSLKEPKNQNVKEARNYIIKWFTSVVASVKGYNGSPPRGVLVLSGKQHIGKTSWFSRLTPDNMFCGGFYMDLKNKDNLLKSISYLVVELGELDATFRKNDIALLKGHIGQDVDSLRLPYARRNSTWKRKTVYCATVNNREILHDQSGNSRFWVVEVSDINLDMITAMKENVVNGVKGYELLQFWKQIETIYDNDDGSGQSWILTDNELHHLDSRNEVFTEETNLQALCRDYYDWARMEKLHRYVSITDVREELNLITDSRVRVSDIKQELLKLGAENVGRKKIKGRTVRAWKMPYLMRDSVLIKGTENV